VPRGVPTRYGAIAADTCRCKRREIERGLRSGQIRAVVATNALELGIDVGSLDISVMAGYPGTIASTLQRAGRAGRRSGSRAPCWWRLPAPSTSHRQEPRVFLRWHPGTRLHPARQPRDPGQSPEVRAFELPLQGTEKFGSADLEALCERLTEAGYLHRTGAYWYWTQDAYPADTISLRLDLVGQLRDRRRNRCPRGDRRVDFTSALTTVHPKAIYIHDGQQYHVDRLDFDQRKAYVRRVDVDYFTDAVRYTQVKAVEVEQQEVSPAPRSAPTATCWCDRR